MTDTTLSPASPISPTAARLLDARIDEVLFGRAWKTTAPVEEGVVPEFAPTIVDHVFMVAPRHYTTDIADTWHIVRALRAEGWLWEIDTYDPDGQWQVVIVAAEPEDLTAASACDESFELAVCLAALRLKQPEVSHG